jgi:hypothetical protein
MILYACMEIPKLNPSVQLIYANEKSLISFSKSDGFRKLRMGWGTVACRSSTSTQGTQMHMSLDPSKVKSIFFPPLSISTSSWNSHLSTCHHCPFQKPQWAASGSLRSCLSLHPSSSPHHHPHKVGFSPLAISQSSQAQKAG